MEWVDIGFQGKDPGTDFRGAGTLGLQQLLAITDQNYDNRKEVMKMYKDSMNAKNWYFFCATGLNITQKILMLVCEEHAFDAFILSNLE